MIDSFFQSVSARTAGFNSVDITMTHHLTKFVIIVLMFIGASPGSTGGGIKTINFYIASVAMLKTLRGETNITIFKRNISYQVILRAFAIVFAYSSVIIIATGLLLVVSDYNFLNTIFEVTSALGTAGLSLGISSEIHNFGKIILILCMFIGRIGPSTLAMVMIVKEKHSKIRYPDEKIIQG
jgi:trk system potassium uptake protein TrkH